MIEVKVTGQFKARTNSGKIYQIVQCQQYTDGIAGQLIFYTSSGLNVNPVDIDKGVFIIKDTKEYANKVQE
jgi:hypothetical protein